VGDPATREAPYEACDAQGGSTVITTGHATYELRVQGHLDDHWTAWLGDLAVARHEDGTSTLTGAVADQAALHGLLAKVRDLGIPLLSVTSNDPHPTLAND